MPSNGLFFMPFSPKNFPPAFILLRKLKGILKKTLNKKSCETNNYIPERREFLVSYQLDNKYW